MPKKECFNSEQAYLVTLLHELVHATGHSSRLKRLSVIDYKTTKGRAEEELTAEIGSMLLAAHFGIDGDLYNHASYVNSWKTLLSPKEIMRAVNNASKAFEYLIAD